MSHIVTCHFCVLPLQSPCSVLHIGFFWSLQVIDRTQTPDKTFNSVLINQDEMEVVRTLSRYCIPYFLGFDQVV
jgi:hypothetical protein